MGGIVRIARQVYADEKSLLSFYRGLSPNMVGNAASWGFYFMWYAYENPPARG
jgi:solute carrier family 25 (mitochondrial folate transporter), member 32